MYSPILHGIRLQKWRNLRVSLQNPSAFSNLFSSASATDLNRKSQNFSVSYLIDSLGLTSKLAESIFTKLNFDTNGNPASVLNLLKNHGFTDSQISSIVTNYPKLLTLDAEKSLSPKLKFLQARGASSSELTQILSKVPKILSKKGDKTISRYYDFVKDILEADKSSEFKNLCHSSLDNKIRNVSVLRELGVPQKRLFPLLISNYQPICGKEKFEESLKKVLEMGFDPKTSKFVDALRVVYGYSEKTIEERVNVYKRLGFSEDDVWEMFKKCPFFLNFSEKKITQTYEAVKNFGLVENDVLTVFKISPRCIGASEKRIETSIETFLRLGFSREEFAMMVKNFPSCLNSSAESINKKTEFLVKKMNWPLKAIVSNPSVLGYSLEKRTIPRCNVIKALMCKSLIGSKLPPLSAVLAITDEAFLNKFVMKHSDDKQLVSQLIAVFNDHVEQ